MGTVLDSFVLLPAAHAHLFCLLVVLRKIFTVVPRPQGCKGPGWAGGQWNDALGRCRQEDLEEAQMRCGGDPKGSPSWNDAGLDPHKGRGFFSLDTGSLNGFQSRLARKPQRKPCMGETGQLTLLHAPVTEHPLGSWG
jgi:hypothetical protein